MTLGIFDRTLKPGAVYWPSDPEAQGTLAIDVLDAVQTVVDVLVDGGVTYKATFAPEQTAYTDFRARNIVVSSKPLREGGRPLADIVDIIIGFVVHEVGHTKLDDDLSTRVEVEWPRKVTPARLCNILQDVRLERYMAARFPGLADVFGPTFDWVAAQTIAPGKVVAYGARVAERMNFVGAVLRYERYVGFATDPESVAEREWWAAWGDVSGSADDDTLFALIREGLAHIHDNADTSTPPEPEGPTCGPEGPVGKPPEDEPPTDEPPSGPGPTGKGPEGEGNPDDDEGGDQPGEGKPEGDDKPEGEGKNPGGSGGDDDTPGGDKPPVDDPLNRPVTDGPMGKGGGGNGGEVKTATPDDVDEGLDPEALDPTMDDVAHGDALDQAKDRRTQALADRERGSERIKAGIYGSMKVRVQL